MNARTWAASVLVLTAGLAWPAAPARGQDAEQWKKMYEGAIEQLKAAQERKNQLAAENEKLVQHLDALKKELAAAKIRVDELSHADAVHAEKTYFLRAHYMAWQAFVGGDAELKARWRRYLEDGYLAIPRNVSALIDREWPVGLVPPGVEQPATQPAATQPAGTQPAGTQPATSQPAGTMPAATQPDATVPATTVPATTVAPTEIPATTTAPAPAPTTTPASTRPG